MSKLTHVENRIVVSVDINYKNSHTFSDGTKISLERKYDCFDRKHTEPVNAIVISADNIPEGSEIIIHHNATDEVNRIHNYKALAGENEASTIRYYSISESEAFAWRDGEEWFPLPGYDFALRVFKPYAGILQGVEPTLIKGVLFVTTGEYKNNVCVTLKASDYTLIFQDISGREKNIIRFRSTENIQQQRECEVVALHNEYTKKVLDGELWVGLTKSDCKPIKELTCQ